MYLHNPPIKPFFAVLIFINTIKSLFLLTISYLFTVLSRYSFATSQHPSPVSYSPLLFLPILHFFNSFHSFMQLKFKFLLVILDNYPYVFQIQIQFVIPI